MPGYLKFGEVPPMHHIAHYTGGRLLHEYCFTRGGFEQPYSICYLHHPPTNETFSELSPDAGWPQPAVRLESPLKRRHFQTGRFPAARDFIARRLILAYNDALDYGICHPRVPTPAFFANNDGDELFFLLEGEITLHSLFGTITVTAGDYLIIPRSCPYRFDFSAPPRLLYVEAKGGVGIPLAFLNTGGQLKMDAPYSERAFKTPAWDAALFEGDEPSMIVSKRGNHFTRTEYPANFFKMSGWDGCVYPYAINLNDIQPKTGRVHLPPPAHLTFAGAGFAVMSFLPRLLDFDERAIPCPFYHSSVDCDELLFYVSGEFTSRKGIDRGSISYHPGGIPHGPHPGAYKNSIGMKQTQEQAVMVDTYQPLLLTGAGEILEDPAYPLSWRESAP